MKFEKITSIQEVEEIETYNFTVPKYHNYFLDGILNANSGFVSEKGQYNADNIFRTLMMSTRELPWIGVITSFPRLDEEHDFTYKKYIESTKDTSGEVVGSKYMTWEVKPRRFFPSGQWFDFIVNERSGEIVKVPIELRQKVRQDPEGFKSRYMCMLGTGVGDFFQFPSYLELIRECDPVVQAEDVIVDVNGKKYLSKQLMNLHPDSYPRVIALDAGEKHAEASLIMGRKQEGILNGKRIIDIVVDCVIVWTPSSKEGITVDIDNYQAVTIQLCEAFNVLKVRMDHWNAAAISRHLMGRGIITDVKDADYESYAKYRTVVYREGLVVAKIVDNSFNAEGEVVRTDRLRQLRLQSKVLKSRGEMKPRVEYGRQDLIDTFAHICDLLLDEVNIFDDDTPMGVAVSFRGDFVSQMGEKEKADFMFGKQRAGSKETRRSKAEDDDWAVFI